MDITLNITIPSDDVSEFRLDFLMECPNNETIPDPTWVDPEDGSKAPEIPKYTDKQWFKKYLVDSGNKARHRGRVKRNVVNRIDSMK